MGRSKHCFPIPDGTCALIVDKNKRLLCHFRKKYYILMECSTDGHFSAKILKPLPVLGFSASE